MVIDGFTFVVLTMTLLLGPRFGYLLGDICMRIASFSRIVCNGCAVLGFIELIDRNNSGLWIVFLCNKNCFDLKTGEISEWLRAHHRRLFYNYSVLAI